MKKGTFYLWLDIGMHPCNSASIAEMAKFVKEKLTFVKKVHKIVHGKKNKKGKSVDIFMACGTIV